VSIPSGLYGTSTAVGICGADGTFMSAEKFWCYAHYWIIKPTDGTKNYLIDQFRNQEKLLPFSIFFNAINEMEDVADTVSASSSPGNLTYVSGNVSVTLMSQTVLEDRIGSTVKTYIFELQKWLFWISYFIFVLWMLKKTI